MAKVPLGKAQSAMQALTKSLSLGQGQKGEKEIFKTLCS